MPAMRVVGGAVCLVLFVLAFAVADAVAVSFDMRRIVWRLERAEDDLRGHVQHVDRAKHDAGRGESAEDRTEVRAVERALNGEELADETVRPGQADARHHEENE